MEIRSTALALGLSITLCAPALAQETKQTVEGAQKFLELVLPGATIDTNTWAINDKSISLERFGKVENITTVGRCHTRVKVAFDAYERRMPNPATGRHESFSWSATTRTLDMHFDKWTEVEVVSKRMTRVHTTTAKPIRLYSSSESLSARLAHALDFLRQNCDAASATGF